ncbi:MAG: uL15m family ribosomal protein [Candidatus Woesearchaeota archaeon]
MVVNKRRKVVKYRGSTTHGGGHRKKRRGAGNRGGRGRAGRGKKGKAKKQMYEPMGKHGFASIKANIKIKTLNLSQLEVMVKKNLIQEKEGMLDLGSLGYQKLLGTGKTSLKLKIKIDSCSQKAKEKIEAAGGAVISAPSSEPDTEE